MFFSWRFFPHLIILISATSFFPQAFYLLHLCKHLLFFTVVFRFSCHLQFCGKTLGSTNPERVRCDMLLCRLSFILMTNDDNLFYKRFNYNFFLKMTVNNEVRNFKTGKRQPHTYTRPHTQMPQNCYPDFLCSYTRHLALVQFSWHMSYFYCVWTTIIISATLYLVTWTLQWLCSDCQIVYGLFTIAHTMCVSIFLYFHYICLPLYIGSCSNHRVEHST